MKEERILQQVGKMVESGRITEEWLSSMPPLESSGRDMPGSIWSRPPPVGR